MSAASVTYTIDAETMARATLALGILNRIASGEELLTAANRMQTQWLAIVGRLDADAPLEQPEVEHFIAETIKALTSADAHRPEEAA